MNLQNYCIWHIYCHRALSNDKVAHAKTKRNNKHSATLQVSGSMEISIAT